MNKVIVHMSSYFDYDLDKIFDLYDLCSVQLLYSKKVNLEEFFFFFNYNSNVTFQKTKLELEKINTQFR